MRQVEGMGGALAYQGSLKNGVLVASTKAILAYISKRMANSWVLENVEVAAKEKPDTFFIPDREEREGQAIGDEVRLHFLIMDSPAKHRAERMWVEITEVTGSSLKYRGILTNEPSCIADLSIGDEIEFGVEHIAQTIIKEGSPYWIDSGEQAAFVSKLCLEPGGVIKFLYREGADGEEDSGWRMFSGQEDDEYANTPSNIRIINVGYLLDIDPSLLVPLKGKIGEAFERVDAASPWQQILDWDFEGSE
jgi:uncharacterized protein YegJ (DUF2314 family)